MKLLFRTKLLNTCSQIRLKITIPVGKLEEKLENFAPNFSFFSNFAPLREECTLHLCKRTAKSASVFPLGSKLALAHIFKHSEISTVKNQTFITFAVLRASM